MNTFTHQIGYQALYKLLKEASKLVLLPPTDADALAVITLITSASEQQMLLLH